MKKKLSLAFAVKAVPSSILKTIAVLLIGEGMKIYEQDPVTGVILMVVGGALFLLDMFVFG